MINFNFFLQQAQERLYESSLLPVVLFGDGGILLFVEDTSLSSFWFFL